MPQAARYAQVVIDIPILKVDRPFEYSVPDRLVSRIKIGSVVLAPFARSQRLGYVVDVTEEPTIASHLDLEEVLEEKPVFSRDMVGLARFTADYYLSTMGEVLRLALPPGRGRRLKQVISSENGVVKKRYIISQPKVDIKTERYARLKVSPEQARQAASELAARAGRQQRVLEVLAEGEIPVHKLVSFTGASYQSLKGLEKKDLVEVFEQSAFREPDFHYPEELPLIVKLTNEQQTAVSAVKEAIDKGTSSVFLLQGVTGSGKTEVYLRALEYVLSKGKTGILLVPEIALTPQTVNRVRLKFGDGVAVLHSGLGLGERYDQWRRIKEGEFRVVVGARSALFAPLEKLGLIVVDEEQEGSYKQDRNPRYHARQLAVKRASLNGACVILGSATPSIESKFRAEKGDYIELDLRKRIEERPLPSVTVVDMREEHKTGNRGIFSFELQKAIKQAVRRGEKIILFLNRRGFANFILCRDCGLVIRCKHCQVSLTYHEARKLLKCHHCGYSEPAPSACPRCGSHDIGYYGVGTQRVESELKALFPEIPVTRMDTDTTARRDAHRKKLLEFKAQETGILLGTQMIAKGLDFPDVTLVGIINADTALHLPEFRAAERTFQLLMQVSGRAGRGPQPGRVIVQTYNPDNYAIEAFVVGDYDAFYGREITLRDALSYPPFSELINILLSGKSEEATQREAERVGKFLAAAKQNGQLSDSADVLGPVPAPLPKLKDRYRWHILVKAKTEAPVKEFLKQNMDFIVAPKESKVTVAVDVDPISLL